MTINENVSVPSAAEIACRSCVPADAGIVCQADLGGDCPSDPGTYERALTRHPEGCAFCPAELLGLERDRNGDPLCQTCPHLKGDGR